MGKGGLILSTVLSNANDSENALRAVAKPTENIEESIKWIISSQFRFG